MSRPSPLLLRTLHILTLCVLLGASSSALAQDKAAAAQYFQEGQQAYAGGDYGAAIFKFAQAYEEDPNGIFLYMTSLAYLKSENIDKALEFGKKAKLQGSDLDDDMRARNDARIQAMETGKTRQLRAQSAGVGIAKVIKANANLNNGNKGNEGNKGNKSGGIGGTGWTGVVLTATGVGLMVGSIYFNRQLAALCIDPDAEKCNIPANDLPTASRLQTSGLVMLGTGAALTLVGGGLFVYALGTRDNTATLQLVPTRQGAYTGIKLRF